jgi:hypothetical protein
MVFKFLVIKTLDPNPEPDPDSLEMLDPDPGSMNRIHNTGRRIAGFYIMFAFLPKASTNRPDLVHI